MGIVKGFTDIIAPVNLATNGSFRINQRGSFKDMAPIKVGDYVCDAWKLNNSSVDSLFAFKSASGTVYFEGYGKKNQSFTFRNSDNQALHSYFNIPGQNKCYLTAALLTFVGASSVPAQFAVYPRRRSSTGYTQVYNKQVKVKPGTWDEAVSISETGSELEYGADITISLLADGYFYVAISNFREIPGQFVNPPRDMPVNYADDLLRCKRYYQSGTLRNEPTSRSLFFPVEMAGTPTIAINNGHALLGAASWDEVLPRSVSYSDTKGFQSYRYLSMGVSGSGSITRYVTPMSQATLSVKLGTPTNSVSSTYGTASNSMDAVSTNPMLLGSGSNGTPGTRSVAITEISPTKITVTYTNAVAGDGLYLWVSGADSGSTENCHYWAATV